MQKADVIVLAAAALAFGMLFGMIIESYAIVRACDKYQTFQRSGKNYSCVEMMIESMRGNV